MKIKKPFVIKPSNITVILLQYLVPSWICAGLFPSSVEFWPIGWEQKWLVSSRGSSWSCCVSVHVLFPNYRDLKRHRVRSHEAHVLWENWVGVLEELLVSLLYVSDSGVYFVCFVSFIEGCWAGLYPELFPGGTAKTGPLAQWCRCYLGHSHRVVEHPLCYLAPASYSVCCWSVCIWQAVLESLQPSWKAQSELWASDLCLTYSQCCKHRGRWTNHGKFRNNRSRIFIKEQKGSFIKLLFKLLFKLLRWGRGRRDCQDLSWRHKVTSSAKICPFLDPGWQ